MQVSIGHGVQRLTNPMCRKSVLAVQGGRVKDSDCIAFWRAQSPDANSAPHKPEVEMRLWLGALCWVGCYGLQTSVRSVKRTPCWSTKSGLGPHLALNLVDGGPAQLVYRFPDILDVADVLTAEECQSLIVRAGRKGLSASPVAYAGWSEDVVELVRLFGSGPAVWLGLFAVLVAHNAFQIDDRLVLSALASGVWALATACVAAAVSLGVQQREVSLQQLRTSTSVVLNAEPCQAELKVLDRLCRLLPDVEPSQFEALTVIRYRPGQSLAPHYDANRAADVEDMSRGGQTLATFLVYLNDVDGHGETRFNKLGPLDLRPTQGHACLFFPADKYGNFDSRLEHEGRPLPDDAPCDKWVARVWVHASSLEGPPCGLHPRTIEALAGFSHTPKPQHSVDHDVHKN